MQELPASKQLAARIAVLEEKISTITAKLEMKKRDREPLLQAKAEQKAVISQLSSMPKAKRMKTQPGWDCGKANLELMRQNYKLKKVQRIVGETKDTAERKPATPFPKAPAMSPALRKAVEEHIRREHAAQEDFQIKHAEQEARRLEEVYTRNNEEEIKGEDGTVQKVMHVRPQWTLMDREQYERLQAAEQQDWSLLTAEIPDIVRPEDRVATAFVDNNREITDPVQDDKHVKATEKSWQPSEELIFFAKYRRYAKDFSAIAACLPRKDRADCVAYYYNNKHNPAFLSLRREVKKRMMKKWQHQMQLSLAGNEEGNVYLDWIRIMHAEAEETEQLQMQQQQQQQQQPSEQEDSKS
eukprot:TRINITY_DN67463_c0_g1_i1.p1 TRINITY_DN67463_c0_g1~~TRINITY_DN67463_c0_g1_i1.p1  ORF type:complete len:355 (-),score=62.21 TRINITY_DN67463_c0_g1_i1:261-1325(-)